MPVPARSWRWTGGTSTGSPHDAGPGNEWTPERAGKFAKWLKDNSVSVVFLDPEPGPALSEAMEGLRRVQLETVDSENPDLVRVMESNPGLLKAVFQPN